MKGMFVRVGVMVVCLIAYTGCAVKTGPQVSKIGIAAQHVTKVEQAAKAAAISVDVLITSGVVQATEVKGVLEALRSVGQGGLALADALDAVLVAKSPEARANAEKIVANMHSALLNGILAIPSNIKQQAVREKIEPVFTALATVAIAILSQL